MTDRGERALGAELKFLDLLRRAKVNIEEYQRLGKEIPPIVFEKMLDLIDADARFGAQVLAELDTYSDHEQRLMAEMTTEENQLLGWFGHWLESHT